LPQPRGEGVESGEGNAAAFRISQSHPCGFCCWSWLFAVGASNSFAVVVGCVGLKTMYRHIYRYTYFMYKAQARKAFGFQARDISMCSCVRCSFDLNVLKFKDQIA